MDEAAMRSIASNTDLHRADRFEAAISKARTGLANTEFRAYEAGLVSLGILAGTSHSYGNDDDSEPAAPDAVWIFDDTRWITWEAKSEASATGEVGSENVRQAQAHLRYTEAERHESAPSGSIALLMSPKPKVLPAAHMLAEDYVYLVRPPTVLEIFDRLVRAWRTARSRTINTLPIATLAEIFQAENALPSQWLPLLQASPLKQQTP